MDDTLDDDALMKRVQQAPDDCAAAWEVLDRRHRGALVGYLISQRRCSPAEAEDIAQEALLRLYTSRNSYQPNNQLRAYLLQIARRLVIDWARKRGREVPTTSLPEGDLAPAPVGRSEAEREEVRATMRRYINQLPEAQRQVLTLIEFDGLSHEEVAVRLGVTPINSRQLLFRAKKKLAEWMEADGLGRALSEQAGES